MARNTGLSLKAVAILSYSLITNALTIDKRSGIVPSKLPGNWTSQGCYSDTGSRALITGSYTNTTAMTIESCISYCSSLGSIYAGVEYSSQCYCGSIISGGNGPIPGSDCSMTCSGNATEACGGPNALNLFWSGAAGPQTNPGVGGWAFSGCYAEGTTGRALTYGATTTGGAAALTVGLCLSACKTAGYNLAGVEYSGECYCGNSITNGGALSTSGLLGCNMLCNGNSSEFCGGLGTLDVYDYNHAVSLPPYTTVSSTTKSTSSAKSSSSVKTTSSTKSSSSSVKTSSTTSVKTSTSSIKTSSTTSVKSSSASSSKSSSTVKSTSTSVKTSSSTKSSLVSSSTKTSSLTSHSSTTTAKSTSASSTKVSSSSSTTTAKSTSASSTKASSSSSTSKKTTSSSTSKITLTGTPSSTKTSTSPSASATLGIKNKVGGYTFQGCYTEATNVRALSGAVYYDDAAMTLEECASSCAGWNYFGVEYGEECYCGNSLGPGSVVAALTDCNFICPGNQYEYCGAGNRLELYFTNVTTTSGGSGSTATTSATISVSSIPVPTGWTYEGCYQEPAGNRMLMNQQPDNAALTQASCISLCASNGYTLAGVEYGVQCFCDTHVYNGAGLAKDQSDCNMPCSGNAAEECGSAGYMNLFSKGPIQEYTPPTSQKTDLPPNWTYVGCLQDNLPSNELNSQGQPIVTITTFPYMAYQDNNNTATRCIETCQKYGYNAAGTEYGTQCFCGDVENIYVASDPSAQPTTNAPQAYTRNGIPQIVADSQCNTYCSGDGSWYCGSGNLLSYYKWNSTTPLYDWSFPTGTNAGEYSLLIGGVIVPLMTTQAINGKALLIEKYGSGEPNGTGAYELDLSLTSNYKLAWREMLGLETDVFCSAGVMLPDRAGRILTVGGWAGESNFGVRMYWPDGHAGVNGTHQWAEDPGVLSLQVPRWYPSAMVMANGSVMIIGGEIGSNAAEQPTLELLPATGVPDATTISGYSNTTVYLDFLQRTSPFNLYPFVCVLPSGIFIAYWNEARIINEKTFDTVKTLPNIPGAVNDDTGGRTYQLEGAFALLPQSAPYTDNLEILICGGSTIGGGYALDNCVTTRPEDPNPTWTIERMPSRRVMPCIAGLPDGTYLILNGAQHGVAGFGLGDNPNYNAVLYDPSKPVNSRMSVMANTTVARLYHSEAITLLDGRVLITGSDPTGTYDAAAVAAENEWPEEYRVEVFTPPYLLSGATRPVFTVASQDWAWAGVISFTMTTGTATKVTLLGSVVSTHGNAMGQRTIFPAFSCNGAKCTVTAPPDAHHAPPGWYMMFVLNGPTPSVGTYVRIGGDPAELGNWPANTPGFDLPGVGAALIPTV